MNASQKAVTIALTNQEIDKEKISQRLKDSGFEVKSIEKVKEAKSAGG